MDKQSNLDRIEIVLVDTQDGANIGSTCRAMKTMGLTHLVLVTDKTYDENRVRTLALHASDLWENRKEFRTLQEALDGCILSVAATRRHGKSRKMSCMTPEELANHINGTGEGRICVVFGCEANGLSDEQVQQCSMVVTIPTSELFPSLNLSQAVQIICYSLFMKLRKYPAGGNIVTVARVQKAAEDCVSNLESIGFFKNDLEKDFTTEYLRDEFARSAMTESEIARMEKIFAKTAKIALHKQKEQKEQK